MKQEEKRGQREAKVGGEGEGSEHENTQNGGDLVSPRAEWRNERGMRVEGTNR